MNKSGEIIIVDDDHDDTDLLCETLKMLKTENKVICFSNAQDTLVYLRKVDSDPFFILSDLRMPIINGFELKQMIYADENLVKKAIPFVLFSTTIDSLSFNTALLIGVQGFFVKPASFNSLTSVIEVILKYMHTALGNRA